MGFEPTTFCMASRRSSQLSYSRTLAGRIARRIWRAKPVVNLQPVCKSARRGSGTARV
jgi:hypothetical protein